MIKVIIGLFAGMVLMGALVAGPLSQTPVSGRSAEPGQTQAPPGNAEEYHETIRSLLREAGDEIQDKDIDQYYHKLVQEYDLDEASSGVAPADNSSPAEMLPDIKNITQKALNLPLKEAGKNIQDKEIARFYYKLLKDAGWEIESD